MKHSKQVPLMLDALQDLSSRWWVFVACAGLIAVALLLQTRAPRAIYRAVATLEVASNASGETPSAAMIEETILRRASSDVLPAARVLALTRDSHNGERKGTLLERLAVLDRDPAGVFAVEYVDEDPQRAVDLANALAALAVPASEPSSAVATSDTLTEVPADIESLRLNVSALQRRADALHARNDLEAEAFAADRRALGVAREQLGKLEAELEAARSSLASADGAPRDRAELEKNVALLHTLDGQLQELAASSPADEAKLRSTRHELEAVLLAHRPGRALPGAPMRDAHSESNSVAADVARLEAESASKRLEVAALVAKVDRASLRQNELTAAVAKLDAAHVAYERALAPEGAGGDRARASVVARAVTPTPLEHRPARLAPTSLGFLALAIVLLGAVSWQRYRAQTVFSEAGLRAVSAVPVLASIPVIPYLASERANRRPLVASAVFTALSLALLVVVLSQVIGR